MRRHVFWAVVPVLLAVGVSACAGRQADSGGESFGPDPQGSWITLDNGDKVQKVMQVPNARSDVPEKFWVSSPGKGYYLVWHKPEKDKARNLHEFYGVDCDKKGRTRTVATLDLGRMTDNRRNLETGLMGGHIEKLLSSGSDVGYICKHIDNGRI